MRHCFGMRDRIVLSIAATASIATLNIGSSQTALSADIPAKPPILKAPNTVATNWTGFYLTGGVGYGLWTAETVRVNPITGVPTLNVTQRQGGKGWLGRVGAGFDYQFSPHIVAGVFADADISSIKGTVQDPFPTIAGEIKQTWSWAAGARAGWLITPELLSYANGGYTNAHFSSASMIDTGGANLGPAFAATGFVTPSFSRGGWFIGGGAEAAIAPGWFWRNEYRYAYYGTQTLTDTNPATGGIQASITFKPTVQTVTSQIVYKFNSGVTPVYRAPVTTPRANWSGGYVNAGGGYGMWAADTTTTAVAGSGTVALPVIDQRQGGKGWLGRVGGGYDHQLHPRIVAGVFADFDFSNLKGSIQDQGAGFEGKIKQTWSWAAGGRAGWLITPSILSYVNAGYTQTRFSDTTMLFVVTGAPFGGFGTPAFTTDGWFLGGGMEASIASGWFWRNEYRYSEFGRETIADTSPAGGVRNNITFKPTVQTVTTQLVYKFNTGR
jgi:outer membrane immunogenic protein